MWAWRVLVAVGVLASFACSSAGTPITETVATPIVTEPAETTTPAPEPTPTARPPATPAPTPASLVFEKREGRMFARITVTPGTPRVGEEVTFTYLMRHDGEGSERGGFDRDVFIEGGHGVSSHGDCAERRPKDDYGDQSETFEVENTFRYPGPYRVSLSARMSCLARPDGVFVEGELDVSGEADLPKGETLLPHWSPRASTTVGMSAVSIEADAEKRCVYARAGGDPVATLWPVGFRARFYPLRIYDERDKEVWREGEPRESPGQPNGLIERVPERCRTGERVFTMDG